MQIKEINKFTDSVFEAVLKLLPQLDPDAELPTKEHFKEILKSNTSHFFIVELDSNNIIGMFTITTYKIPTGTKVWIEDVVIDESQRGKGIGEELMQFAIGFSKSTGAKAIDLTSRPYRTAANQLYRKMGFILRETNVYRYFIK